MPGSLTRAVEIAEHDQQPIDIGSRRELFVDGLLIERLAGGASRRLHQPVAREVVLEHQDPWEGSGSGYHSLFHDGERYRLYYKAWHLDVQPGKVHFDRHPLYCCYAESDDGLVWNKPKLGLYAFDGSKENNIVMTSGTLGPLNVDAGHPAVFLDEKPNVSPEARYKAIFRSSKPNGLLPFQSADGLHWSPMTDEPMLAGLGAFDSQNLAFWDPTLGQYRAYWRIFTDGRRAIRTASSDDLVHWGPHTDLTYEDSPPEQLYTNGIKPYWRAPHLLLGFPTRYVELKPSPSLEALPELDNRKLRASATERYGHAVTEGLLMASRNGTHFERWNEAFLPPGGERPGTWNYGQQYIAWYPVETPSSLLGAAPEISLYASESYWTAPGSALRRYTLRLDGFVSVNARFAGGELVTRPLTFTGSQLRLNFATSAAGSLAVELQQPDGTPAPGFALADCDKLLGNSVDRAVTFGGEFDVSRLAGKPVRLRFVLQDADLYAMKFGDREDR